MDANKSLRIREAWVGSISLLCIGAQFALLIILSFINVGFVSADLPGRETISELSWDQWIALYCFHPTGVPLLLTGLWVLGLLAWIINLINGRTAMAQRKLFSVLLVPAWVLFIGLNGVSVLHYWQENSADLYQKLSIYFTGPPGKLLPKVSFLPGLVPLAVLACFGFSRRFRTSSGWGRQMIANLPIVLLVIVAEFHVNFARPMCEDIVDNSRSIPQPTSSDVIGYVTWGILLTVALGLVLAQIKWNRKIQPLP